MKIRHERIREAMNAWALYPGGRKTPVSVRADNFHVIPLCHAHHRTGGYGVAIHAGRKSWEEKFGTEAELLSQVLLELGEATV